MKKEYDVTFTGPVVFEAQGVSVIIARTVLNGELAAVSEADLAVAQASITKVIEAISADGIGARLGSINAAWSEVAGRDFPQLELRVAMTAEDCTAPALIYGIAIELNHALSRAPVEQISARIIRELGLCLHEQHSPMHWLAERLLETQSVYLGRQPHPFRKLLESTHSPDSETSQRIW